MPTRVMNKERSEDGGFGLGIRCVDEIYGGDQRLMMGKKMGLEDFRGGEEQRLVKNSSFKNICYSDESSSSIGKNSDLSENSLEKSGDGEEVQSVYKGPLDAMEALEEVLPMRRGISKFYNGKSKSFASLADASASSSVKDIAKPDNPYNKRRRNLIASNMTWDKTRNFPPRTNGGGITKRSSSRTTLALALAVAMSSSDSEKSSGESNSSLPGSSSSSPRKAFPAWRSYSLADLQQCAAVARPCSNSNQVAVKPS